MTATKGAMTSLPTPQTIYLSTVEEPENSRINFRDSLKFFQEQLVINGASFPSPLPSCRSGSDTLRKNGPHVFKEHSLDSSKLSKDSDVFEEDIQSVRSCKIAIPTVDTILESVRVLRAIQKSQEERGSTWNLDVTSKSDTDTDFNCSEDWIKTTDIKQNDYSDKENEETQDKTILSSFATEHETDVQLNLEINETKHEEIQSDADLYCNIINSNAVNEICPFWPSNTLANNNYSYSENAIRESIFLDEMEDKNIELENKNTNSGENLCTVESITKNDTNSNLTQSDNELQEQIEESEKFDSRVLQGQDVLDNLIENKAEQIIKSTKNRDTPHSLRAACTDLLNSMNSNTEEKSKETLLKTSNITTEILKIETYEDINTQKHDFLLNESLWKDSSSPNDSSSIKIENNDCDSGIGTQRSASSLSPNNPSQTQKDSWSDSCSSHYASAECSPYHSLNSVFESSLGLNMTLSEAKTIENTDTLLDLTSMKWEDPPETIQESQEEFYSQQESNLVPQQIDLDPEKDISFDKDPTDSSIQFSETYSENAELDTEISYCNFITNYTIENPCKRTEDILEEALLSSEICDNSVNDSRDLNGHGSVLCEQVTDTSKEDTLVSFSTENELEDEPCDLDRIQKFTAASCDLISIVESLYTIKENPAYQILPATDAPEEKFEETLCILSRGAFSVYPESNYLVTIEDSILFIEKDSEVLCSLNMKYAEVSIEAKNILKIDNRMGRCLHVKCDFTDLIHLKKKMELHCLKHWQTDCLQLVHYPLKCHQNVVIIDLGSCSTRAGILMDQPTLPSLFFPTICATDKRTGTCVYGMEALQSEVRQHSNLSFPVRPTVKITKHTIDIDLLEGLFKKIFYDLKVDPSQYTVQVCLPRNLSINAQTALVKLLLEDLKVNTVSLTNQALLTLYAHEVSTAVVVDIGDRTDVLPVVDGFIVENGVTKLPHGGQRLIHHMKHGLAEKRISLSNDIDSFVVQYIIENLAYVAEDYENEEKLASHYPDIVKKAVTLQPAASESLTCKSILLEEARYKIPEGLFNPDLWGLDSPGIHHLVQKAIQATSVDARKQIAENIYVSGGVTMLPGFVERLNKEVAKLSKTKIVPKVYASNYRYHCTYIGACKFAKMEVFPQVCINLQEFSKNSASALKKCALYF